jgi:hypothetical protein
MVFIPNVRFSTQIAYPIDDTMQQFVYPFEPFGLLGSIDPLI